MADPNYWIIVGSPENFATTRALGFTLQGIKSRHRKKAEQMHPGDKIAYYVTDIKAFGATATITSDYYEGHEVVWRSSNPKKQDEDYPFRVRIEADVILAEGEFLPAEEVARGMEYVRKWPAENWTLAFQGNVHKIDRHDFGLIRSALIEAASAAPVR